MTLKQIADIVGVSPSTVSRVINKNDTKCASKEVREKIWDTVSKTGYIPNKNAQSLRSSSLSNETKLQTKHIACVFGRSIDVNNDPFFNSIYRSIEQEAFKLGYFIKFSLSFNQLFHPASSDLLNNTNIHGIIILGRCNNEHLNYICKKFNNVIMIGLNALDVPIDQIICNGYECAKKAVNILHDYGFSEIGYIGEKKNEVRYTGYVNTLKELNIPFNKEFVSECDLSMEGGYLGALKLLKKDNYPKSIFCCNDITAIGVLKAINELGLKIPEDISLISIDNIEMTTYIDPVLTSINIPKEEMGKMAMQILVSRINKIHKLPIKVEFPFNIRYGESTKTI